VLDNCNFLSLLMLQIALENSISIKLMLIAVSAINIFGLKIEVLNWRIRRAFMSCCGREFIGS